MRGELRQTIVVGTVTMHHNTNRHLFSSQEQTLLFNPNPRQIGSHRGKLQWYFCLNHTLTEDIKTVVMHLMVRLFSLAHSKVVHCYLLFITVLCTCA